MGINIFLQYLLHLFLNTAYCLTYHVVPGKLSSEELMEMVKAGKGKATLKTVEGENLFITHKGKNLMVTDENGGLANITIADVNQSNGVIHVINKVLLPK